MNSRAVCGLVCTIVLLVGGGAVGACKTNAAGHAEAHDRQVDEERRRRAARDEAEHSATQRRQADDERARALAAAEARARDEAAFASMDPVGHLAAARSSASASNFREAQRHLDAIPAGRRQPPGLAAAQREIRDAAVRARAQATTVLQQSLERAHFPFTTVETVGDDRVTLRAVSPACTADFPARFSTGEAGDHMRRVGIRRLECVLPSGDVFGRGIEAM